VQAAIAAVHGEAEDPDATDWPQIVALYALLLRLAPNPMRSLNHAAAVAMVDGPARGLEMLDDLAHDHRLKDHHRLHAVRAHLLEQAGDLAASRARLRRSGSPDSQASRAAVLAATTPGARLATGRWGAAVPYSAERSRHLTINFTTEGSELACSAVASRGGAR
jgi:predicted RNA polymerase sigma factor